MTKILRRAALTVLWALAGLGVLCGMVWGATALGAIQPLIVISGSMEPEIMTGDLLIAVPVEAESLAVGDVASLPNALTGDLVTHRIEAVERHGASSTVSMKGDNNEFSDALDYTVSGTVWKPALRLDGWGAAIMRLTTPGVVLPLIAGLVGLLGLSLLDPAERHPRHAVLA